ncbi:hypothetical protein [Streptomyces sp. VRA16 Mangrove soil]|uniref:Acg family FMN-binding oxidoreductase n=1 Tax=Streptomyces sp. VRA16 Mangrove soil TaxID=2817434 RepID=UPI001A9D5CE7|nr:hypothetical protein [Streptomyces sp. VRA16 Mangrove soil]MBO1334530.1 hypothetical protein [Streptomyces sp. VRA16 Mangrove soil]
MAALRTPGNHAVRHLVRAAVTAPSLHNSQPWLFSGDATGVDLYADPTRRVPLADPDGRQLVIGCGAALFNIRLAMRHLGFRAVVHPFPDPWRPAHLARVDWGAYEPADREAETLHRALRSRRTHRGPFQPGELSEEFTDALRERARAEGADLNLVAPGRQRARLAELVRAAEDLQRTDPGRRAELVRWTQEFNGVRRDGVPLSTCTYHPDCVSLAGRDFLGLTATLPRAPEVWPARTGAVAVLTTRHDTPADRLRAGQALQRMLLYAAAHEVSAAFHTQPLEVPELRVEVRATLLFGQFPQMILRLGHALPGPVTPRRPVSEVVRA